MSSSCPDTSCPAALSSSSSPLLVRNCNLCMCYFLNWAGNRIGHHTWMWPYEHLSNTSSSLPVMFLLMQSNTQLAINAVRSPLPTYVQFVCKHLRGCFAKLLHSQPELLLGFIPALMWDITLIECHQRF